MTHLPATPGAPSPLLLLRPGALRIGAVLALLLAGFRFLVPWLAPGFEGFGVAILGSLACCVALAAWWLLARQGSWPRRGRGLVIGAGALALTWLLNHPSMGLMWFLFYGLPLTALVGFAWTALRVRLPHGAVALAAGATLALACLPWTLLRLEGLQGDHSFVFDWRWRTSSDERLLQDTPMPAEAPQPASDAAAWPGFRGPERNGVVRGALIRTQWGQSPPRLLWRHPIGAGWSSLAISGNCVYTLEQREELEITSCRSLATGELVWQHEEEERFFEAMGGPGPRATPAVDRGVLYSVGATGLVHALDAATGTTLWRRDLKRDADMGVPVWGFAGSPWVAEGKVFVAASGRLVAYDRESGDVAWRGEDGGASYSSPTYAVLAGTPQIVQLDHRGALGVDPVTGRTLWRHEWSGSSLVQPAVLGTHALLVSAGEGKGVRRLHVERRGDTWSSTEVWTSSRLKPNFNDFVVHRGHAYGFDGSILACVDLETGERRWKGGRFGHGQLLLFEDQELLLVVSERGELALVAAEPEAFRELGRIQALSGKTWNHPALAGTTLVVRNGREIAAYDIGLD